MLVRRKKYKALEKKFDKLMDHHADLLLEFIKLKDERNKLQAELLTLKSSRTCSCNEQPESSSDDDLDFQKWCEYYERRKDLDE